MSTLRQRRKKDSNNSQNNNKNVCANAVAIKVGVADNVRYLHTFSDLKRACSTKFSVRSVKSKCKKTVGGSRAELSKIGARGYIVHVDGHTLLLNKHGNTVVDTSPRLRDARKIISIYGLY